MSVSSPEPAARHLHDRVGVCQWFHYEAYEDVEMAVDEMRNLGVRLLRTGISWADYHRRGGKRWYDWQMERLAPFDVLLSIWHTPPSISMGGTCASPPARLSDYADFVDQVVDEYGDYFEAFELWNEPNNRLKWDFPSYDPVWRLFGEMVREAAFAARRRGRTAVLGGMIPVDPHWLELMRGYGVLEAVDAVAIHGFPEMWWPDRPNWDWYAHWHGWADKVRRIATPAGLPVWITETGLATWEMHPGVTGRFDLQVQCLQAAVAAPAERVYWYSMVDLDPAREAIEGFHVDENEYHLGLTSYRGERKPAWWRMQALLDASRQARRQRA